jgi:hypothetical protein
MPIFLPEMLVHSRPLQHRLSYVLYRTILPFHHTATVRPPAASHMVPEKAVRCAPGTTIDLRSAVAPLSTTSVSD